MWEEGCIKAFFLGTSEVSVLVEDFVTETFFYHLRYIFSPLFIVHQLQAPSTDSVQEDDFRLTILGV